MYVFIYCLPGNCLFSSNDNLFTLYYAQYTYWFHLLAHNSSKYAKLQRRLNICYCWKRCVFCILH